MKGLRDYPGRAPRLSFHDRRCEARILTCVLGLLFQYNIGARHTGEHQAVGHHRRFTGQTRPRYATADDDGRSAVTLPQHRCRRDAFMQYPRQRALHREWRTQHQDDIAVRRRFGSNHQRTFERPQQTA